jgi:signal peptidase II
MIRVTKLALLAYAVAVIVVISDQALKYWVLHVFDLPDRGSVPVIGPFRLSMVWNKGVSFGFLNGDFGWTRWALSAFDLAVATGLALWVRRAERPLLAIAIGLVIGGAIGNLIDRLRIGAVADFLDFHEVFFPWVFNIADSGITVGVILLLWDALMAPRKRAPA